MHSRHYLSDRDFTVLDEQGARGRAIPALLDAWRASDRIAFVAEGPESGVRGCGPAALGLTRKFYARQEVTRPDFFDYPLHYAIVAESGARTSFLGPNEHRWWSPAWCRLDVWPSTHHLVADPTPEALFLAALLVEPSWLIWPVSLPRPGRMEISGGGDDHDVRALMRARLKGVIHYGHRPEHPPPPEAWSLKLTGGAATLLRESLERLGTPESDDDIDGASAWFAATPVEAFLEME